MNNSLSAGAVDAIMDDQPCHSNMPSKRVKTFLLIWTGKQSVALPLVLKKMEIMKS